MNHCFARRHKRNFGISQVAKPNISPHCQIVSVHCVIYLCAVGCDGRWDQPQISGDLTRV
jgi:hypothetical protein